MTTPRPAKRQRLITPEQQRELLRWLQLALVAIALSSTTALVAGWLTVMLS